MATKSRSWLLLLILIPLVMCGGLAAVIGLGALYLFTASEQEVNETDRAMMVTVDDITPWLDAFQPDRSAESLSKSRYFDGSYDVDYEYEHPDGSGDTLYLQCAVSVERRAREARQSYVIVDKTLSASLRVFGGGDMEFEDTDLFHWGDQSRCALMKNNGIPVGNYFICRSGKAIFYITLVGVMFDERETLEELLLPKLRRLQNYEP